MLSGGDYAGTPSGAVSGGDGKPLQQAGETAGTGGGNVSPASGAAPGGAPASVSGSDALPDIASLLSGMSGSGEETALYAGTETVSGNGADALQSVSAIEHGFAAVCLLLGFIAGILLMNGFFTWKVRE